ncbi:MAG: amidohydrolase [Nanoarchaeota archaeon]|nr:amidohydrolase [Nanoarchaeota archaeon]
MILKNCRFILTQDPKRRVLENCDIRIEDDKIAEIAPNIKERDDKVDFSKKVVMPGMINTHVHLPMTLFRGYSDNLGLHDWLKKMMAEEAKLTAEQVYWGTMLGCLESLQFGTTTAADFYYYPYERAKAVEKMGLNAFLDSTVLDKPFFFKDAQEAINHSEKFIKDMQEYKKITPVATCHSIYLCGTDTLEKIRDISNKYNVIRRIHVSETERELKASLKNNKATPIEYLNKLDWLDDKTMLVHCNWATNMELRMIRDKGCKINHNPVSNMKLAYGKAMPLKKMLEMGITVSLATDGPTSNNNLDLFDDMKVSALMHKFELNDPMGIPDQDIFDMGNIQGAKALKITDKTGSIEPGKWADLIAMDVNKPHFTPLNKNNSILSHIIYCSSGQDVSETMVRGKFLVREGKFTNCNPEEIMSKVQELMGD